MREIVALAEEKFAAPATGGGADRSRRALMSAAISASMDRIWSRRISPMPFPASAASDPDFYAAQLYAMVLGGGMSSRLFQEVREKRGLCYSIYAFTNNFQDSGFTGIYAGTGEKEAGELSAVIAGEMEAMTGRVSEAELARAKAQLKSGLLMGLERPGTRAEQIAGQIFTLGRVQAGAEIVAQIDAVDAAARAALRRPHHAAQPSIAAMGPVGKLERHDIFAARFARKPRSGGMMKPPPPPGKMSAMMHSRPMAFMRGLTFPGGQQPVIRGQDVYLRYPRIADYANWARLRGESREFLTKWEPVWAEDELTRGAFRRRIKRYQKETRLDSAYVFFVFRTSDDTLMGGCTLVQCAARRHAMLRPGLLDRRALRPPGLHDRRGARAGSVCLRDPGPASHRSGLPAGERAVAQPARQGRVSGKRGWRGAIC